MSPPGEDELQEALASSQRLGMLGPRPIDEVVAHARAFVDALAPITGLVVDLGTGGGVPGLVIAIDRPDLRLILVDRRATRTDHVARLVTRLDLADRVDVRTADAAELVDLAGQAEAVVARGFGAPEVTLTAAAPLLSPTGRLVVSEPPTGPDRWTPTVLAAARPPDGPAWQRLPHADARVAIVVAGPPIGSRTDP